MVPVLLLHVRGQQGIRPKASRGDQARHAGDAEEAADVCAAEPEKVARFNAERGIAKNYDYALAAIKGLPYGRWREDDAEGTVRFYSLRLKEAGMIKSSPQKIIAQATDWRLFSELKKELKE